MSASVAGVLPPGAGGIVALGVLALAVLLIGVLVGRLLPRRPAAGLGRPLEILVAATERLAQAQAEMNGRLGQVADGQVRAQETLAARLASIDATQRTLADLSGRVAGLHALLGNKQARGALGQVQMEDLVKDLLPPGAYRFQARLGNGRIADCLLVLPNPPGVLCLDAKYPLEAYRACLEARTDSAREAARRAFAGDVLRHVRDIAERYIVPGETADQALMFVPAESVYAEIHAHHPGVVEEAFRRRVWIVSPTTLMATLTTVRAILKDARLAETATRLRGEIQGLVDDVARLAERAERLGRHFEQAATDVRDLRISATKIVRRGEVIDRQQLGEDEADDR
ncbi:DNA recombination protein RmuC [Pararhodospirillum oryzae]|uniref:DNA recombination protein RmuC n=1 Tax=Pararhodospirillum oryzae TaxID=478448 RepID=UPI001FE5A85F|nr:DNA recombination protein RmuC [Pararhodospirillum oryzae]